MEIKRISNLFGETEALDDCDKQLEKSQPIDEDIAKRQKSDHSGNDVGAAYCQVAGLDMAAVAENNEHVAAVSRKQ